PETAPGPGPDRTVLVAALRQLPTPQRMAIVLHHLCDLSVEQVASETGAPVGTVKARLSRGRATLAKHLAVDDARDEARDDARGGTARKENGRVG
ncbi:sigma factor-like helix-turn-helix DNA-binding protein, partial [Streptomyces acidiscabies]